MTSRTCSLPQLGDSPAAVNNEPPRFVVLPVIGKSEKPARDVALNTDLLVLTVMSRMHLTHFAQVLDDKLHHLVTSAIEREGFCGHLGQSLLLDLEKLGESPARPRYILIVGLGEYWTFCGHTVCGLFRLILDQALKLGVKKITMPIAPNRLTSETVSLMGTAAIMRCRLEIMRKKLTSLEEIEILCAPQAKRHLDKGLAIAPPRCRPCANPKLA